MPDQNVRIFLNALAKAERSLPAPTPGAWKGDGVGLDFLSNYAKDIRIEAQIEDPTIVHSVPSVFARAIQFSQALIGGPLHKAMVSQWRGLLAVFALKDSFNLDISAQRYDVPPLSEGAPPAAAAGPGGVDDLHIRTILRNQLPKPVEDWDHWWLIYCQGELIGATSPWSIVFTPADYTCPANIGWQKDGLLGDPTEYFVKKAATKEMAVLKHWVGLVLKSHEDCKSHENCSKWGMGPNLEQRAGVIRTELEAWQRELAKYSDKSYKAELDEDPVVADAPYCHFFQSCKIEGTEKLADSDLLLKGSKGDVSTIVFSRLGIDPKARVYGPLFGDQVDIEALWSPKGEAGWVAGNFQPVPLPYVIAEDAFFPPKLLEIVTTGSALNRGSAEYALPLTPAFFEYFNLADLISAADRLKVNVQSRYVQATLRLPLQNGKMLKVEKKYDLSSDIVKIEGVTPSLAVWPDFCSPDWFANFGAMAADSQRTNILAAPLIGNGTELQTSSNDGSQRMLRLWPSMGAPIGFSLRVADPGSGNATACGLVLRAALPEPPRPDDKLAWKIGFDFGTSNTTVMRTAPGGKPELLSLAGRTVLLTAGAGQFEAEILAGLYPKQEVRSPFPTALGQAEVTLIGGASGEQLRYTPRFVVSLENIGKLVPNLKWAGTKGGGIEEEPLREYLRGLVRYIAAEARWNGARRVEFEWSYPLALPDGVQKAMKDFWGKFSDTFCDASVLEIKASQGIAESDAVCRRLAYIDPPIVPVSAESLSITVDVGGGSTDIGFWTKDNLIDQVSVKLAGENVLDPSLLALPGFKESLFKICSGKEYDSGLGYAFDARPSIFFNSMLTTAKDFRDRAFGSGDPRRHPVVLNMPNPGDPPWSVVRSQVYLFYAGITFYMGLHARKWITGMPTVYLYFGGRGSSLLPWITSDTAALARILSAVFVEGLKQEPPAPTMPTEVSVAGPPFSFLDVLPPKHEVAGGALYDSISKQVVAISDERHCVLGEQQCRGADGSVLDFFKSMTAAGMENVKLPPTLDSSYIAVFLGRVLKQNLRGLNLDEPNLTGLTPSTAIIQQHVKISSRADGVLQPIFISELKAAMHQYLERATGMKGIQTATAK